MDRTNTVAQDEVVIALMGATVKQVRNSDGNLKPDNKYYNRVGKVVEVIFDEKGACHVKTDDDVWCPTLYLDVLE